MKLGLIPVILVILVLVYTLPDAYAGDYDFTLEPTEELYYKDEMVILTVTWDNPNTETNGANIAITKQGATEPVYETWTGFTKTTTSYDIPSRVLGETGTFLIEITTTYSSASTTVNYIHVEKDVTRPVITIIGESTTIVYIGDEYEELGATAWDAVDGDITDNIIITSNVDVTAKALYNIDYRVTDSAGNIGIESRIVWVQDGTPTLITKVTEGIVYTNSTLISFDWEIKYSSGMSTYKHHQISLETKEGTEIDKKTFYDESSTLDSQIIEEVGDYVFTFIYQTTSGSAFYEIINFSVIYIPVEAVVKKSGGGCSDCTPPTIGLDSKGERFVSAGLILNGQIYNVDYFKTHMPMQSTVIYHTNNATFKIYENSGIYNIMNFQLGLGIKEIGTPLSEAQALIEIHPIQTTYDIDNPVIDEIVITDKDNILHKVEVTLSVADCGSINSDCLGVEILWSYAKAPEFDVLMTNIYDFKRNSQTDYFNDGLHVHRPLLIEDIPEPYKYECKDTPLDQINGPVTRNNCHFRALTAIWDY